MDAVARIGLVLALALDRALPEVFTIGAADLEAVAVEGPSGAGVTFEATVLGAAVLEAACLGRLRFRLPCWATVAAELDAASDWPSLTRRCPRLPSQPGRAGLGAAAACRA